MAVTTKAQAALGFLNIFSSGLYENRNRLPRGGRLGFRHKFSLATTEIDNADDSSRLVLLPAGMAIMDAAIRFEDDADTNGTPALVFDLITENEAGTDDSIKLIEGSTAGQTAGGADRIDDGAVGVIYSEARYVTLDVTTAAATAAAADFWLTLDLQYGILTPNIGPALKLEEV